MVATSFEGVGGATGEAKISDVVKCDATPVTLANIDSATQILIWVDPGYKYLYYLSDATDEEGLQAALENNPDYVQAVENAENDVDPGEDYWWGEVDRITEETKPSFQGIGWADGFGSLSSETVALGSSYWYYDADKADGVTSSGQVSAAPSTDIDIAAGWTMICNPYPANLTYANVTWTDLVPVTTENIDQAAQILVPTDGGAYTYQYYLSDATDEEGLQAALDNNPDYVQAVENAENDVDPGEDYWWGEVDRITEETKPSFQGIGWADTFGSKLSGDIQEAGLGFWVMLPTGSATATATFAHP